MKCENAFCNNHAVVQVEIQAVTQLTKWVCSPHYTELKNEGAVIQILDDVATWNKR